MAQVPTLSRQTTGNTAYYSFVSSTSTVHPDMSTTTAAPVAGTSTKTNRAPTDSSDPAPDYHPETNGSTSTAPVDSKAVLLDEKRPLDAPVDEKEKEVLSTKSEVAGPSNDVVVPTSLAPSSPSREEQLSQHAVGAFSGGAVLAVRVSLVLSSFLEHSAPRNVFRPPHFGAGSDFDLRLHRTRQAIPMLPCHRDQPPPTLSSQMPPGQRSPSLKVCSVA